MWLFKFFRKTKEDKCFHKELLSVEKINTIEDNIVKFNALMRKLTIYLGKGDIDGAMNVISARKHLQIETLGWLTDNSGHIIRKGDKIFYELLENIRVYLILIDTHKIPDPLIDYIDELLSVLDVTEKDLLE
jgi:hypothetical protein